MSTQNAETVDVKPINATIGTETLAALRTPLARHNI